MVEVFIVMSKMTRICEPVVPVTGETDAPSLGVVLIIFGFCFAPRPEMLLAGGANFSKPPPHAKRITGRKDITNDFFDIMALLLLNVIGAPWANVPKRR